MKEQTRLFAQFQLELESNGRYHWASMNQRKPVKRDEKFYLYLLQCGTGAITLEAQKILKNE